MKLFSRKALAAVATTVALTTAGLSAPALAEEGSNTAATTQSSSDLFSGSSTPATTDPETGEVIPGESLSSDLEAKEIREWVGVFTAVIGALSAAFVFIQRLTN